MDIPLFSTNSDLHRPFADTLDGQDSPWEQEPAVASSREAKPLLSISLPGRETIAEVSRLTAEVAASIEGRWSADAMGANDQWANAVNRESRLGHRVRDNPAFKKASERYAAADAVRRQELQGDMERYMRAVYAIMDLQRSDRRPAGAGMPGAELEQEADGMLLRMTDDGAGMQERSEAQSWFDKFRTDVDAIRLLRRSLTPKQFQTLDLRMLERGRCRELRGGNGPKHDMEIATPLRRVIAKAFGPDRVDSFMREFTSGRLRMHLHEADGIPVACAGEFNVNEEWACLDWLGQHDGGCGTARAVRVTNARTSDKNLFCDCNWQSLQINIELMHGVAAGIEETKYAVPYVPTLLPKKHTEFSCPAKDSKNEQQVRLLALEAAKKPGVRHGAQIDGVEHVVLNVQVTEQDVQKERDARANGETFRVGGCLLDAIRELRGQCEGEDPAIVRAIRTDAEDCSAARSISWFFAKNPVPQTVWRDFHAARAEHARILSVIHASH